MSRFLISALLVFVWLGCQSAMALPAEKPATEWILKQRYPDFGDQVVYIGKDAVRVDCVKHGYSVLCKAPDWQVCCYRPLEKKVWEARLKAFDGCLLSNPFVASKFRSDPTHRVGETKYAGLKCFEIHAPTTHLWTSYATGELTSNLMICEFLNRYYFLQDTHLVPLYKKILAPDNNRHIEKEWLSSDLSADLRTQPRVTLETLSVQKAPYRASDFDLPKNLIKVARASDIVVSNADKSNINDLVDSLGFTTDVAGSAKAKH